MKFKTTQAIVWTLGLTIASTSVFAKKKYPDVYPFKPMHLEGPDGIYYDMVKFTEDRKFIKNFKEMMNLGLAREGKTLEKPWSASYWPLAKGTIADPFEKSKVPYYLDIKWLLWEGNIKEFEKRKKKLLSRAYELSEEQLAKLAPSEKYDLLLGDLTFDLTHRLWADTNGWGSKKQNAFKINPLLVGDHSLAEAQKILGWGFTNAKGEQDYYDTIEKGFRNSYTIKDSLAAKIAIKLKEQGKYDSVENAFDTALEQAKNQSKNYVEEKKNERIAGWEGICNGWATAAGLEPRPRKAISFKLPNGKKLKFYPSDIRGLTSLFYVNSLIQDSVWGINLEADGMPKIEGTVSVGNRCNLDGTRKDEWGRKYDDRPDPFNGDWKARCSGVHPAKWHMGLVNMIGKQGRSFIVERKVANPIDNHPMYSYKMEYFNPLTGDLTSSIMDAVVKKNKRDQFFKFRHPKTKYIVGVQNSMVYLNYMKPSRKEKTSEKEDLDVKKTMLYDLELDENYNIVGGQWRAKKVGAYRHQRIAGQQKRSHFNWKMPDFFWTITKDYKASGYFDEKDVEAWVDKTKAPPKSWKKVAMGVKSTFEGAVEGETDGPHGFFYHNTLRLGGPQNCRYLNKKTGKYELFQCEYARNRPQPLINVVNVLLDLAK